MSSLLAVGCPEQMIQALRPLLSCDIRLHAVPTCREAITWICKNDTPVIICANRLPDGGWQSVLDAIHLFGHPALLAVFSTEPGIDLRYAIECFGYSVDVTDFDGGR